MFRTHIITNILDVFKILYDRKFFNVLTPKCLWPNCCKTMSRITFFIFRLFYYSIFLNKCEGKGLIFLQLLINIFLHKLIKELPEIVSLTDFQSFPFYHCRYHKQVTNCFQFDPTYVFSQVK